MRSAHLPWLVPIKPSHSALIRLFCFPYAGGNAAVFGGWSQGLPDFAEVYAIELPGRGYRVAERPMTTMSSLTDEVTRALLPHLDKPFVFFGHSMGALLSFEVTRQLRRLHGPRPCWLFVSGCRAPQTPRSGRSIHALPEPEFLEELSRLKGSPSEVLMNRELMAVLLPGLRADFQAYETYEYLKDDPLCCPIHAVGGTADAEVMEADLEGWRSQTDSLFTRGMVAGDHFFLHSARVPLLQILSRQLCQVANAVA